MVVYVNNINKSIVGSKSCWAQIDHITWRG